MNDILPVYKHHCLNSLSSKTISIMDRQIGVLQIGLEVAVAFIPQINKVFTSVEAYGNPSMSAQVTIYAASNVHSASTVEASLVK